MISVLKCKKRWPLPFFLEHRFSGPEEQPEEEMAARSRIPVIVTN